MNHGRWEYQNLDLKGVYGEYQPGWRKIAVSVLDIFDNAILKEHLAFDEDTSMIFNPKQQRWWLNKVKKAMREDQAKWYLQSCIV